MRRNTFPPRPRPDDGRLLRSQPDRAPEPPKRKIFNCIVDDTALIAGAKKSTRDGIRKWISQDAIRLFVPLHTLSQLNRLKHGDERINIDSRDALKWLDDITSMPSIDDRVQLEGVEEAYSTWAEVEQFLLPETLLSMEESESEENDDDDDDYAEDLESSFNALDVSDETSMSSTHSLDHSPKASLTSRASVRSSAQEHGAVGEKLAKRTILSSASPDRTARNSSEMPRSGKPPRNHVPAYLRPLFNHILWRIHKESNADAALESFILLTNDPNKQMIAQKFGIRAKRLEQLRDAVAREDREYKNHLAMYKMESGASKDTVPPTEKAVDSRPKSSHSSVSKLSAVDSDDEDEVILKRAPRGPANPTVNRRVFDPNDFERANSHHSPGRGNRGGFNGPRGGRGGPPRGPSNRGGGRGGFNPRGGAYVAPSPAFRQPTAPRHDLNQPIDPDSFARPAPRGNAVRGARRSLWEPI